MKLVNLTPHALNLPGGVVVPPSGQVARVTCTEVQVGVIELDDTGEFGVSVPLVSKEWGAVEGLPAPEPGTMFIVSGLVKGAVQDRPDVAAPGALARDSEGKVTGLLSLSV